MDFAALGLLLFRGALGAVFLAHGYNHVRGGGKIAGTARWFESLGMRPGSLHAWIASVTEVSCGALLIFGFLTPFACAGVIGTMTVAWITNHRTNGFFVFRPGEGYEYVMTLTFAAIGLAGVGSGGLSLDNAAGWFPSGSGWAFGVALVGGFGGAAAVLATSWRPRTRQSHPRD